MTTQTHLIKSLKDYEKYWLQRKIGLTLNGDLDFEIYWLKGQKNEDTGIYKYTFGLKISVDSGVEIKPPHDTCFVNIRIEDEFLHVGGSFYSPKINLS